jgi:hypothetical protein
MTSIAQVVFILSPQAITTLMNGSPGLDKRLRTVLTLVDGVTPVAQFEPFLRSLEPIEPKFNELEQLGYLLRVGTVSPAAVKAFRESVKAGGPISTLQPIDALSPDSGFVPLP